MGFNLGFNVGFNVGCMCLCYVCGFILFLVRIYSGFMWVLFLVLFLAQCWVLFGIDVCFIYALFGGSMPFLIRRYVVSSLLLCGFDLGYYLDSMLVLFWFYAVSSLGFIRKLCGFYLVSVWVLCWLLFGLYLGLIWDLVGF